jgi:hypothetical protein
MEILDSGDRREFGTGAVRDMACKGRCDLLPWDVIGRMVEDPELAMFCQNMYSATHGVDLHESVRVSLNSFVFRAYDNDCWTAMIEVAFHYESGAKKYSERNWENGIPVASFLDSAGRHFLKYMRGDKDEPHDRAVVWNLLGALWTIKHHPELAKA